ESSSSNCTSARSTASGWVNWCRRWEIASLWLLIAASTREWDRHEGDGEHHQARQPGQTPTSENTTFRQHHRRVTPAAATDHEGDRNPDPPHWRAEAQPDQPCHRD